MVSQGFKLKLKVIMAILTISSIVSLFMVISKTGSNNYSVMFLQYDKRPEEPDKHMGKEIPSKKVLKWTMPQVKVTHELDILKNLNCTATAVSQARPEYLASLRNFLSPESIIIRTDNCANYFRSFPIEALKESQDYDTGYPLAFSHLVNRDIGIFELLLSLIYRPHNFHCVYVDKKAPEVIHKAIQQLVNCYRSVFKTKNIFFVEDPAFIYWGHMSILDADLKCMELLLSLNQTWKYFMNTAGTEMPNHPYAKFESTAQNAQSQPMIESYPIPSYFDFRVSRYFEFRRYGAKKHDIFWNPTRFNVPQTPFQLKVFKGMKNLFIPQKFVNFSLHHPVARSLLSWVSDVGIPDEVYFQTLAHITHINHNITRVTQDLTLKTDRFGIVRYTQWAENRGRACYGTFIRSLCNFALMDLPFIRRKPGLVINKFNIGVDPRAALCQWKYIRGLNVNQTAMRH